MTTRWLVVEDSRAIRLFLQQTFSHLAQLDIVETAEQGLAYLQAHTPDLVLSDIFLPGISGFDFARLLLRSAPSLPVCLMTDDIIDRLIPEIQATGIGWVLSKGLLQTDPNGTFKLLEGIQQQKAPSMERLMSGGGEVRTYILEREQDVQEVLEASQRVLAAFPRQTVYQEVLPELVRAAFARRRFVHGGDSPIRLSVGADWHKVGVGISVSSPPAPLTTCLNALTTQAAPELVSGLPLGLVRQTLDLAILSQVDAQTLQLLGFDYLTPYHGQRSVCVQVPELVTGAPFPMELRRLGSSTRMDVPSMETASPR